MNEYGILSSIQININKGPTIIIITGVYTWSGCETGVEIVLILWAIVGSFIAVPETAAIDPQRDLIGLLIGQ